MSRSSRVEKREIESIPFINLTYMGLLGPIREKTSGRLIIGVKGTDTSDYKRLQDP